MRVHLTVSELNMHEELSWLSHCLHDTVLHSVQEITFLRQTIEISIQFVKNSVFCWMLLVQSQSVLCPFMTKHSSLSKLDLFWHMTVTFPSTLNCFLFYKQSKKCEKENITVNNKKKCFKKKNQKLQEQRLSIVLEMITLLSHFYVPLPM